MHQLQEVMSFLSRLREKNIVFKDQDFPATLKSICRDKNVFQTNENLLKLMFKEPFEVIQAKMQESVLDMDELTGGIYRC